MPINLRLVNSRESTTGPKDNIAAMPMADYNKNSSYQAKANEAGNTLLKESAKALLSDTPSDFHVADFGCSHGKNSMDCIKSVLDGCLGIDDPIHFMIYLNDLPMNDFGEVFKCLNDPSISFEQHSLFDQNRNASISTMVNGKSFNSQVFSKNQLDLGFCFCCLHWLEKPIKLSRGIFPRSTLSTSAENETIARNAHQQLVEFLKHRSRELKTNGRLVFNIMKEATHMKNYDKIWNEFVTSKGYELNQFEPVSIPMYCRSAQEIRAALDEVDDEFEVIYNRPLYIADDNFGPDKMKSVFFYVVLKGVKLSNVFNTNDKATSFVNEFFAKFVGPEARNETELQLIVLERL